ncbi:synaptonemal complex protein 2 isoform X4 [Sebastes umbrosus]|uniref:synaptonemal complex protein 2 isoform X4 n=1 Tax=Sebastes umbrosus TaxID=72105 RepID=UPI00189CD51C|nr:synaptonemal complex protein 2 isoform X4 [Sebastes umbrosus]
MAPGLCQLEKVIDEALKSGDVQALDVFLQSNIYEETPMKCSQQFLTKLDKLVSRGLDHKDSKSAGLGLAVLYKSGKNLQLPGVCQGLSGITSQVLKKMVQWFEKCRQLWIQCGPQWDETLFNLSEDFLDALMAIHEASKEGTCKITESFMYPVGQLTVDPRIYILIQKEAIRKFNLILDKIPAEFKKERKILTSQEASDIMVKLAGQILKGGDYDLQTALMEALCRMATPEQRKELADRWFSMEHVATAFAKIRDSEFETDCRKFLNLVNGMQGDRRRVYSYPCLEVYLDKHELLMPADEKLEEFWIDFNLDSHSISFYFSLSDEEAQEGQWETLCINENEVQSYTVTEEGKRQVLQLKLSELVVVGAVEGSSLTIHFSSSLDVLQAARTVYGPSKNKVFVGKTGTSVVKTTVKITMEDNISQVVPESQTSVGESEKNAASHLLPVPSAPVQMVTPTAMRISESATFISSSAGGSVHCANSLSAVMSSNTSVKRKGKPSLEMVRSCDRQAELYLEELRTTAKFCSNGTTPNSTIAGGMTEQSAKSLQSSASKLSSKNKPDKHKKNIPVAKAVDMVLAGQGEEQSLEPSFVPDTQPRTERNIYFNWNKLSVSEMLMMPTQNMSNSLSRSESRSSLAPQQERPSSTQRASVPGSISQKQLHTELTQRLQQVLSESNQDPAPQKKMSKGKSSEQQAQGNGPTKGKSKRQISLEADAAPVKAPAKASAKASTTKALQKRVPPNAKVETDMTLRSKEKRDSEVAGSMVKLISSHYEINTKSTAKDTAGIIPKNWIHPLVDRPVFNMSWLSTANREVSGAVSLVKSHIKTTTNSTRQRKDIFAFDIDTPLSIGGKKKTFTNTSAISSSSIHDSSALLSTTKKGQPVAKEKRHVKKHLFSDTDYSTTDVSWLRESSRKPKPQIVKYPRQAPVKPKAVSPHTSYESPDLHPPYQKPVKGNTKPNKKPEVKERVEQPKKTVKPAAAPSRRHAAGRRSQRTAVVSTKSYRDPDTDNSQSESEKPPDPKEKPYVKKPLFSDTDYSTTDVSWLRESSRKPQIIKYPRQAPVKPKAVSPHTSYESPDLHPPYQKPVKGNTKPNKKKPEVEERVEQPKKTAKPAAPNRPHAAGRRPQRTAAISTKCYRDPDTDNSQSESEKLPDPEHSSANHLENAQEAAQVTKKKTVRKQPSKSYVKPESSQSESESETEQPPTSKKHFAGQQGKREKTRLEVPEVKKRKSISSEKTTETSRRLDRNNQSDLIKPSGLKQQRPENVLPETSKLNKKNAQEQMNGLKDSWAARQTSFCPSPPFIERMRSAERSAPTLGLTCSPLLTPRGSLLPASPDPPCKDTPSPILLLPKPRSAASSKGHFRPSSFYSAEKKHGSSKTQSIQSVASLPSLIPAPGAPTGPSAAEISPIQQRLPSATQSPLSLSARPLLTSTLLELDKPSMPSPPESPFPEDTVNHGSRYGYSKVSSASWVSLSPSSTKDSPTAALKTEKTPSSGRDLFSGPSRKRHISSSSNSEEDEKEERKKSKMRWLRSPRMKPRKLFKSFANVPAEADVSRVMSSSHTMSSSHWEAEVEDGDMDTDEDFKLPKIDVNPSNLCQQFSSELKKKFQNRYSMVEVFSKQSLKTAQQHVSSFNTQVTKHRTQKLEQVRKVLLEEIHQLEQDDTVLKNMEKDLTTYWKKQTVSFHSYRERGTVRNEALKKALQSNVCHSLEYEERIFTSQMCLIRKDMKSVQDRLLSEMQEGELQSVKRGMHALFFP